MSFRGADLTTNLYVGNVNIGASLEEMRTAITTQGVDIVELEELKRTHNRFKSFRLRIRKTDLTRITDPDFWPIGITVKNFFRGKRDMSDVNDLVSSIPSQ